MRKKSWVIFALVVVSFFIIISCKKTAPTGLLGAGKIKLTETQTPTPDVNFMVYIHQETTPVVGVQVVLHNMANGTTATAVTDAAGLAGLEVNSGGQWNLEVSTFDGFKSQYFAVEPLTNTFFAVNYGIPSLDLELVSGSESIPIWPTTLVYKVTYHTKFERAEEVIIVVPEGITCYYPQKKIVAFEGDKVECTFNIPKSFEGYNEQGQVEGVEGILDYKFIKFKAVCVRNNTENTSSNERTLEKNWFFIPEVDLSYMQVFDYNNNGGKVSYYAGISNIYEKAFYPGYNSNGIQCEAIDAANVGNDGTKPVVNVGLTMPSFTGYGTFMALIKIPTNANNNNGNLRDDNNGWVKVRFYDGVYIDVIRTYAAAGSWSTKCFHWSCTSSSKIDRSNKYCNNDVSGFMTFANQRLCTWPWDDAKLADVYRKKTAKVGQQ